MCFEQFYVLAILGNVIIRDTVQSVGNYPVLQILSRICFIQWTVPSPALGADCIWPRPTALLFLLVLISDFSTSGSILLSVISHSVLSTSI